MNRPFGALHARTFCHATEDLGRVRAALENALGKHELRTLRTEGHHGNPITILETTVEDTDAIDEFFSRFGAADLDELLSSLGSRIDDDCNLFLRIDKQAAFKEEIRLGRNDDVIMVRVRVRSFPAKHEIALATAREYLESMRAGTAGQKAAHGPP